MNKFFSGLLLMFLLFHSTKSTNRSQNIVFEKVFGDKYNRAIQIITSYKAETNKLFSSDSIFANQIIAIAFPELLRYSPTQDLIESKALELLYARYGSEDGIDFSIGYFQMKPSFAEKLENYVIGKEKFNCFKNLYQYKSQDIISLRKERINRLKNFSWQISYLNCFYHVIQDRFPDYVHKNTIEKLRFFATAYNRGFHHGEKEILKWFNFKTFPHGEIFFAEKHTQYNYAEIAIYFYQKNQR